MRCLGVASSWRWSASVWNKLLPLTQNESVYP
jgi:hypothetical protein